MTKRVDEMFAWVVEDDGTEGVPAFPGPNGMVFPMMGADMERMASLRPIAEEIAEKLDKPITLLKFTTREEVEVINP